ncbi:TonB-dependent receptor [Biformimicrobium ophioploci]|nr:TonB-dependent receptor [Microbulbifer sp. NKW57]
MQDAKFAGVSRNFSKTTLSMAIGFATAISGSAYAAEIEEVVVTAQKRAENLQEVPIAISAFTGEGIQDMGAQNLTDLGKFTPGVEMNNDTPLQPTYSIRGIETGDFTVGSDPAVAVYVDGVYAGRGAGAEVPLADLERVEILKGPQGTLFGRNATGGAIHLISKKPQDENSFESTVSVGNYGRVNTDIIANSALTDNAFLRLSASTKKRDSWADNVANDFTVGNHDTQTYRASLLFEPTQDTEVLWRAYYGVMDQGSALRSVVVPELQAIDGSDPMGDYALDSPTVEDRDSFGTSLSVTHDFENVTFTSITSFSKFDAVLEQDEDGTANPDYYFWSSNTDEQEQFSQEFRLNGATDSLKWTLGASYSQEELEHTTFAEFTSGSLESFAVYEGIKAATAGMGLTQSQQESMAVQQRELMKMAGLEGAAISTFVYDLLASSGILDAAINPTLAANGLGMLTASGNLSRDDMIAVLMQGIQPWVQSDAKWKEDVFNAGDYRSTAVYGDFTWSVTEAMDITFGARYTYDEKDFSVVTAYQNALPLMGMGNVGLTGNVTLADGSVVPVSALVAGGMLPPAIPMGLNTQLPMGLAFFNNGNPSLNSDADGGISDSWEDLSGRLVVDYRWNDDVMTYASVSTGFKAGGFNSLNFGPGVDQSFDQENVTNYEAGIKSSLFDNSVRLNASVYFYEYENLQTLDLVGTPIPSYNLRNGDAEGLGGEIEMQWAVTDNFFVAGNYSYLDTEFTRYQIIEAIGETEADSKVGQPRVGTPEHKFNIMGEYTVDLASGDMLKLRADYNWTDERVGSITDAARIIEDYQLLNLRAGWTSASDRYSASLWVQNATDEEIYGGIGGTGAAIGSSPAWRYMPRTYGADFTVRF